ncbi:hypothetical protein BH23ACT1_BH23ACT1_09900 [soil metagenome]
MRDCNIDDVVVESASTGEIINDGVSTRLYISMLVREDEQWKVAVLRREMGWERSGGMRTRVATTLIAHGGGS